MLLMLLFFSIHKICVMCPICDTFNNNGFPSIILKIQSICIYLTHFTSSLHFLRHSLDVKVNVCVVGL